MTMTLFDPLDVRDFASPSPTRPKRRSDASRGPRILFEEDFSPPSNVDQDLLGAPSEPEVIGPVYSATDIEEARRAAFREGRDAGRTAARAEAEATGDVALKAIADLMGSTATDAREIARNTAESAVRFCLDALLSMHPSLAAQCAVADIEAMLGALLPQLLVEPKLTLRVCPPLAEKIEVRLLPIVDAAGFNGEIAVKPDPAIAPDAATLSWSAGAALRDPGALRRALLDALQPLGLSPMMSESEHG